MAKIAAFMAFVLARHRPLVWVFLGHAEHHLVHFFMPRSGNFTPLTTNNVRRRLRTILAETEINRVTPHSFQRTVATDIDRFCGAELAAELLGRTSSEITRQHYIEPDEQVNPVTAEILEALAPRRRVELGDA